MDKKEQHDVERIMVAAERMSILIRDILSFSGLNREVAFQQTDLNNVLQNVLDDQEILIAQKQALIKADSLPSIDAIPLQMNQLFYNLLNNALKFARPGIPLQLHIKFENLTAEAINKLKLPAGREYVQIEFSDNGEGFNEDFSEQIFGLFKRLGNKQDIHGSGIGLALCRKVVENHNGYIYARGRENNGATFFIILPVKQDITEVQDKQPAFSNYKNPII
jgi:two-component system CheB/CheR fusion protein